jgi:hypothetical protein
LGVETGEFYVSYMPMTEVPVGNISEDTFATLALAQKNSQKKSGFRKKLLDKCQQEFQNAVQTVRVPGELNLTQIMTVCLYLCRSYRQSNIADCPVPSFFALSTT